MTEPERRQIREDLAFTRDALRLTNQQIADALSCDRRQITNAFTAGRPLTRRAASEIVWALDKLRQGSPSALAHGDDPLLGGRSGITLLKLNPALTRYLSVHRTPAALILERQELADFLAARLALRPGVGARSKTYIARGLRHIFDKLGDHMTAEAGAMYCERLKRSHRSSADAAKGAREMLRVFGLPQRLGARATGIEIVMGVPHRTKKPRKKRG